ncbi:MAG: hypothetical protein H8E32_16970 [Nitrospinae bacterium]|nr:hypothetical protein [Nitrospinota bacterium]
MSWKIKFTTLIFLIVLPFTAHASTAKEYLDFFKKYELMGNSYDLAIAELYSDKAKVEVLSVLPDGVESITRMNGKKVKEMIPRQMDLVKQAESQNDYSNISVEIDGNKATVRATRYSSFKCYKDNKYYMVIETQTDGTMLIVEESYEEPVQTSCAELSENQLAIMLQSMVLEANNSFPVMIDAETRIEKTSSEGKTFKYHYTLINFFSSMIDPGKFAATMQPNVVQQMCTNSTLRTFLDMGAIFQHIYKGKDNMEITTLQVAKPDCE